MVKLDVAIKKTGKILLLLFISVFILTVFLFTAETYLLLRYSKKLISVILNNETGSFKDTYSKWNKHSGFFLKIVKPVISGAGLDLWETAAKNLPEILGYNGKKVYFVLLQNNTELRPTGGFLGSYAKLSFNNGALKDIVVQDIYIPDGQLKGHVDPPIPIQLAFRQGWFKLRDANWDPDFPTSAKVISWFFEKGNEEKQDGIIAINLELLKDILKITGPLYLPDYKLTVDENNFYQVAQANSEADFFPGSTQKTNILSALSEVIFVKLKNFNSEDLVKLAKIFYKNLNTRQILVNFEDKKINVFFQKLNWGGSLKKVVLEKDKINDYLYTVEANLGANKANKYVSREIKQEIDFSEKGRAKERIKIVFKNTGTYFTPVKPFYLGVDYLNYLRLYLPKTAEKIIVKVEQDVLDKKNIFVEQKEEFNLKGIGFFITIPVLSQKSVDISYELPFEISETGRKIPYAIMIQKQPGINSLPYSLILIKDGKSILSTDKNLLQDTEIKAEIMYN